MIEVLWFVDRFGIKGDYNSIWLRLLNQAGVRATTVKQISLHSHLSGQLLTNFGTRKAPTWRPERESEIKAKVEFLIRGLKPKMIVLAAPEALCVLNLPAEYATLHKLRGCVYEVYGVPAIVVLPMSVWNTQVSQRDIALANYGVESAAELVASANSTDVSDSDTSAGDESDDSESDNEDEEDNFFYVPVMTPVGRMMLQFDVHKLGRYINGKQGKGFLPL